jgi:hypothetical protein
MSQCLNVCRPDKSGFTGRPNRQKLHNSQECLLLDFAAFLFDEPTEREALYSDNLSGGSQSTIVFPID